MDKDNSKSSRDIFSTEYQFNGQIYPKINGGNIISDKLQGLESIPTFIFKLFERSALLIDKYRFVNPSGMLDENISVKRGTNLFSEREMIFNESRPYLINESYKINDVTGLDILSSTNASMLEGSENYDPNTLTIDETFGSKNIMNHDINNFSKVSSANDFATSHLQDSFEGGLLMRKTMDHLTDGNANFAIGRDDTIKDWDTKPCLANSATYDLSTLTNESFESGDLMGNEINSFAEGALVSGPAMSHLQEGSDGGVYIGEASDLLAKEDEVFSVGENSVSNLGPNFWTKKSHYGFQFHEEDISSKEILEKIGKKFSEISSEYIISQEGDSISGILRTESDKEVHIHLTTIKFLFQEAIQGNNHHFGDKKYFKN